MIIARTSQRRHCVLCLVLLAAGGVACGGGASMTGAGGGSGTSGSAGATGSAGTSGNAGTSGGAGTSGIAGTSGSAGTSGNAGVSGSAGASGNAGSGGGVAGASGSAGASGNAGSGPAGRGGSTAGAGGSTGARGGSGGSTGGGGSAGGAAGGAMPSAGCTSATGTPASGRFMIDASGMQREYIIKIPAGYDRTHPYRLIFAFHGRMYDAESVDAGGAPTTAGQGPYYGMEPRSGGSAIFVAPQALSSSWTNANDIPYVNAMIARFKAELCIDQSRIFIAGFSMGAIQTIALTCAQSSVFRAVAPMSGSPQSPCSDTMPIAYQGSHGTNDTTITIANGRMVRDAFRMRNHCTTTTVADTQAGCVTYQGCDPGKPVSWCEFDGVHQPPPFSGDMLWRFFSQF
jgi:poly(3-hydroxybutyrate) depolymerase